VNKPRPLIAVVDDEEAVGRALQRLLRTVGFDVAMHTSGVDVLGWLGVVMPDCVILDMHMVPLDGMEVLCRLMQRQDRSPRPVPISPNRLTAKASLTPSTVRCPARQ